MHLALRELELEHLWVIYPGDQSYAVEEKITVWPLQQILALMHSI
jgi:uncharacterized protein